MEKDDEVKGGGNSYDFGARMYDGRVGRFLSIDPKYKKFPTLSNYSYALNSPILFIDFQGEDPKVAVLFYRPEDVGKPAFDTHIAALKKAGFTVVTATTGEQLLKVLGENSSPDSPIEQLVIISHGSPGGPEMSNGHGGFWTNSELRIRTKSQFERDKRNRLAKKQGIQTDDKASDYNPSEFGKLSDLVYNQTNTFWNDESITSKNKQKEYMDNYKKRHQIVTVDDFVDAINSKKIFFAKKSSITMTGCNIGGETIDDNQEIHALSLAIKSKIEVFASKGYTGPVWRSSIRKSDNGNFYKFNPNGMIEKKSNKIDLKKPE